MKVELKGVKHAAFASQETPCFEATVWIDGKRAGTVSNEGSGGCNSYDPRDLEGRLDAYAATLPPVVCHFNDEETGKPHVMEQDAELLIGELFADWQIRKDFDRTIKNRLVWIKSDGKLYNSNTLDPAVLSKDIAHRPDQTKARIKDCQTLLNLLPRDEAFQIFKSHVG